MVSKIALYEDYTIQVLTDAPTVVFNTRLGQVARVTIGANRTLSITNMEPGRAYQLFVTQGGAGSFTMALPANMRFTGGGSPDWTTTPGRVDIISFVNVNGTLYADFKRDFAPV
jgi:hypothetical protein